MLQGGAFCGSFLLFVFRVCLCHTLLSVPFRLVVTCWERADLFTLFCVMFPCVCFFFSFSYISRVRCGT